MKGKQMAFKKATPESAAETERAVNALVAKDERHAVSIRERYSDEELRSVKDYASALALVTETMGAVQNLEEFEIGNGFRILDDKDKSRLVGVSFIMLSIQFNSGDFGEFASVTLVTQHGDRIVMNDGSTGIYAQLRDVVKSGRYGGIAVPRGLRVSEYKTCKECGKPRPEGVTCGGCGDTNPERSKGATYYLDV
jgi:hypothetical protein